MNAVDAWMGRWARGAASILAVAMLWLFGAFGAQAAERDYTLAAGDAIRVSVFQNPDLMLETRVSENGAITFPLVGSVQLGGLSLSAAEAAIAKALDDGGFLRKPQVSITLLQVRGNQVVLLGLVNQPGQFPLEKANTKLTDALALAHGVSAAGADEVIITGLREGREFRKVVDLPALFLGAGGAEDVPVMSGDVLYVHRAPVFYIYGEVQRPGVYRLERNMLVMQGLAQGGGPTLRGEAKKMSITRRNESGEASRISPQLTDKLMADDVIFVPESLF